MYVNKVEYGDEVLIDLTQDTVDEDSVDEGVTFHAPDGSNKTGKRKTLPFSIDDEGRVCITFEED